MMRKNHHLLSRATMGPTPESLARVGSVGREAWLEEQLHPDSLPNQELDRRLSQLPTLSMSASDLLRNYPRPQPGDRPEPGREFYRPFLENSAAHLLASRYSSCQLLEVMTDFWFNHFNVFGPEALNFYALTPYVMRVIRRNALGRFPDLLLETAKSPAMLYYLDNYLSTREISLNGVKRGLNENYARELLELHTLGVDAGYTLEDIQNAARVLTGWSITQPRTGRLEFRFYPQLHEPGDKKVFGKKFRSRGRQEGISLLRYLALRPETAAHISRKLASRFVSDSPPEDLAEEMTEVYLETGGDIPSLLRTLFRSPRFFLRRNQRAKVKTPLRLAASALRSLEAEITDPFPLLRPVNNLGQPLFQCHPPTGYPHTAESAMSSGMFLSEGAWTRGLAFNRLRGISVNIENLVDSGMFGNKLADALLDRFLFLTDENTRQAVRKAARQPRFGPHEVAALILTSPDFLFF
jgi:uncharacterized protein (DUF1800 family)